MHVLLVTPVNPATYQSIPDLGLGYLAAWLRRAGHSVEIVDCVHRRWDHARLLAHVQRTRPDGVGFKAFYTDIASVEESCRRIKAADPRIVTVVGGPHPSCVSGEEALRTFPTCDYAFRGEAEVGLPRLVDALPAPGEATLAGVPGLVWRDGAGRVHQNDGQWTEELDAVMPAWDLLRPERYAFSDTFYSRNDRVAPVIATRGCPLPCTFCAAHQTAGKDIRTRSVDSVLAEIDYLQREHGIQEISFIDDFFTGHKRFVRELCREVIARGMRFDWACWGVRLSSLDEELVQLMEQAGCYAFSVGVESGSPRILRHMAKHLTVETIEKKPRLVQEHSRIRVGGLFIIGYPEETAEDVLQTIEFARRIPLFMATFYPFNPLPGTPIYEEMRASGALPAEPDWAAYGPEGFAYSPPAIPPEQLRRLYRRAWWRFYSRPDRVRWIAREALLREDPVRQARFFARRARRRIGASLRPAEGSLAVPATLWPSL